MSESGQISELAQACIEAVNRAVGVELDFTQDTLPVLDHYASLEREPTNEVLSLIAPMCGAYFGEVIRQEVAEASWETEGEHAEWRLHIDACDLWFNPVGIAMEVLTNSDVADWGAHLQTRPANKERIEAALKSYGDVRAEDYYRFTVRYEAIEQATLALLRALN